jgi:hypothetical protein
MLKQQRWGVPQKGWSKCGEGFKVDKFATTITTSILVGISIMTTIMKSCSHSASIGTDLATIWALCQKISAHELGRPSIKAIKLLQKWIS